MESLKMYSSHRCKNSSYMCGPVNYPISWKSVKGREQKFAEIQVYLLPWYHVCTKNNVYIKWKLGVWRAQKYIPLVCGKTTLTCAGLQTTPSHAGQYRA